MKTLIRGIVKNDCKKAVIIFYRVARPSQFLWTRGSASQRIPFTLEKKVAETPETTRDRPSVSPEPKRQTGALALFRRVLKVALQESFSRHCDHQSHDGCNILRNSIFPGWAKADTLSVARVHTFKLIVPACIMAMMHKYLHILWAVYCLPVGEADSIRLTQEPAENSENQGKCESIDQQHYRQPVWSQLPGQSLEAGTSTDLSTGLETSQTPAAAGLALGSARTQSLLPTKAVSVATDSAVTCTSGDCKNGIGVQTWNTGPRFAGRFLHGRMLLGVLTYPCGSRYEGQFDEQNRKSGQGVFTWANNELRYVGGWWEDERHGQGKETWSDGRTYQGMFKHGLRHGHGAFQWPDGSSYIGEIKFVERTGQVLDGLPYLSPWEDDEQEGEGVQVWADGGRYAGSWVAGMQHGLGYSNTPDGKEYHGQFFNGSMEGYGEYTWPSGVRYLGQFLHDYKHGYGLHIWPEGNTYEGQLFLDRIEGKGVYTWADGGKYVGDFKNGRMHGYGVQTWADGSRYEGGWKFGKNHGWGVEETPDGRVYRGYWQEGRKHGQGIQLIHQHRALISRLEGEWSDGQLQKSLSDGHQAQDLPSLADDHVPAGPKSTEWGSSQDADTDGPAGEETGPLVPIQSYGSSLFISTPKQGNLKIAKSPLSLATALAGL
eukprot:g59100.t1